MANAETAGFSGGAFQVYTRQPHEAEDAGGPTGVAEPRIAALALDQHATDKTPPRTEDD